MKKVLGLGVATLDTMYRLTEFPVPDSKTSCDESYIYGGGNCANTLVCLSRLGIGTKMFTKTGKDPTGNLIVSSLSVEGVDTTNIVQEGDKSSISLILVDTKNNTRTIINKRGASYDDIVPIRLEYLKDIDLVYLDSRFLESAKKCAIYAKQSDIPVVVEAESKRHDFGQLLPYADVVITSKSLHKEFFGDLSYEKNLEKLLSEGSKIAITTLGKDGAIGCTKNDIVRIQEYPVDVVDTTGAGDAFMGGFIFGYLNKWDLQKSMEFANYIAAQKCTKTGSREGLLYLKDVDDKFL